MRRLHITRCRHIVFGLWLLSPLGCASQTLLNWKGNEFVTADEKNPVARIICIWEAAEGNGLDGVPTRGFAGQILFFTRNSASPVRVNGDVRVFLFDDIGGIEEQSKPIHQFDFLGDAWSVHLQQSTIGPAYNLFVPYVREHVYQTNCALRVRFTPEGGRAVYSEIVQVNLPGVRRKKSSDEGSKPSLRAADEPPTFKATLEHKQVSAVSDDRTDALEASTPLNGVRTLQLDQRELRGSPQPIRPSSAFAAAEIPRQSTFESIQSTRTQADQVEHSLLQRLRSLPSDESPAAANNVSEIASESTQVPTLVNNPRRFRLVPAEPTDPPRLGDIFHEQRSTGQSVNASDHGHSF